MLTNATLTRIDRRQAANAVGEVAFAQGATIAVRCFAGDVTGTQKLQLGATLKDADALVCVGHTAIVAAGQTPPADGDRLVVTLDQVNTTRSYEIIKGKPQIFGGLSHFELYVKGV